jgi:hypothetical protein
MAAQFRADEEFVEIFAGPGRATHSDEDLAIELLTTQDVSVIQGISRSSDLTDLIAPVQSFAEGISCYSPFLNNR